MEKRYKLKLNGGRIINGTKTFEKGAILEYSEEDYLKKNVQRLIKDGTLSMVEVTKESVTEKKESLSEKLEPQQRSKSEEKISEHHTYNKIQLRDYAQKTYGITLNLRKTKESLIEELRELELSRNKR